MKTIFAAFVVLTLTTVAHAQQGVMIREKVKGMANQNNANQGLPPQYPSANQPAANKGANMAPTPLTPEQKALLQLITDLDGSRQREVTNYSEKLWDSLRGVIHSPVKPSGTSVTKLSDGLAASLVGKPVSKDRLRLAKNLESVLNGSPTPAEDFAKDSVDILKKSGADDKSAAAVGDAIKGVAADIKKKATTK